MRFRANPASGHPIKFVTYEDALELVMALGGKQAKLMKTQFAKILTCYLAGDATMAQGQEDPKVISHLQLQKVSFDEFKDGATVHVLMEKPPLIHAIDLAMLALVAPAQSIRRQWVRKERKDP